jgi:hypothetical protein
VLPGCVAWPWSHSPCPVRPFSGQEGALLKRRGREEGALVPNCEVRRAATGAKLSDPQDHGTHPRQPNASHHHGAGLSQR